MIKSILLAIYVLVGTVIFCHDICEWYRESNHGLDVGEVVLAVLIAAVWPLAAPFWVWFKIDDYIWKKNHKDIIRETRTWS